MFRATTLDEIRRLRDSIERVGDLSDNLVRIGRFGIGLDGILAWAPIIGTLYSVGAGGFVLVQGYRARAPISALVKGALLLAARSLLTAGGEVALPFLPVELVVDLFRAHKWTADLLLRAIDKTRYFEGEPQAANPAFLSLKAEALAGRDRRRAVFLG